VSPLHKYTLTWLDQFFVGSSLVDKGDIVCLEKLIEEFEDDCNNILDEDVNFYQEKEEDLSVILFFFNFKDNL